jgi:NADPH:quinone reductase-like Zn-dependent oxidoreductase
MSLAVRYSQFGAPDVLRVVEVDEPHAGPGEVRVAVRAAGLNPYDYKVRSGAYGTTHPLPSGQGAEFAGVVDEVGDGVDDVTVGDEVLGFTSFAAQAEYVVVKAKNTAPKPEGLDWRVAGGIGLVGNTAKRETDALALGPDDTVLVTAGAGGVGLLATQLARAAGATVVATASEANHDFLRSIGAVPVAYGDGEADRLRAAAPGGYTAALDHTGRDGVLLALELGVPGTRVNSIVDYAAADEFGIGTVGGGRKSREELVWLAGQALSGALVFPVLAAYPLAEVAEAYVRLERRTGLGKIVLTVP